MALHVHLEQPTKIFNKNCDLCPLFAWGGNSMLAFNLESEYVIILLGKG